MDLLICDSYGMHYVISVVLLLVICQQQNLLSSESVNWTCVCLCVSLHPHVSRRMCCSFLTPYM